MAQNNQSDATVNVSVKVAADGGAYTFTYSDPSGLFDSEGNFDFRKPGAKGKPVTIKFSIDNSSVAGIKFQKQGPNAFWIALKSEVGDNGCPTGPYVGSQFHGFRTEPDQRTLTVLDHNNDGKPYRYALRFDLNGDLVMHDPDGNNGEGG
ncbi:MAG: hypothetical protein R3C60_02790 [Parvularculaceae bacterium]